MPSYLFFFFVSLGQIGRIAFLNQEINISLYEIVAAVWLFWLVLKFRFDPIKQSLKQMKILYIFLSWLFATFIFSLSRFSSFQNSIALLYLLRLIVYFVFFIYLSFALTNFKNMQTNYKPSIVLFLVVTLLFSILQYILYPNLRNLSYLGWDPHQYRIFGTFFDTSAAAAVFGLILLYLILNKKLFTSNAIQQLLFIFYVVLGLLTYSRGFYVSLLITIIIFLIYKKLYRVIFIVLVMFIFSLILLPKPFGEGVNLVRQFSIESRLQNEREALNIVLKNPLFGTGYNHLRYVKNVDSTMLHQPKSHAGASFHSSFLIILVSSGIIGLVLFILLLVKLSSISEASKYLVIFLSVFSFFDNILLYPVVSLLFLSLLSGEVIKNKEAIFRI